VKPGEVAITVVMVLGGFGGLDNGGYSLCLFFVCISGVWRVLGFAGQAGFAWGEGEGGFV